MLEAVVGLYLAVHLAMFVALAAQVISEMGSVIDVDYHWTENLCGWLVVLVLAPLFFSMVWEEEFK